jgi:hypothetical protein
VPVFSWSDIVGIAGIVFAILLFVLDKAGKLHGGWLYGLLALAAAMTLFIVIGNSWVLDSGKWKAWRVVFMACTTLLLYSGMAVWIYEPTPVPLEAHPAAIPVHEQPKPTEPKCAGVSREDITWRFNNVLGIAGGGGQEPVVNRFQVHGHNNLDEPITDMTGVWRSDTNGRTLPLLVTAGDKFLPPDQTSGIPAKTDFYIYSGVLRSTNPPREGTVESRFFGEFGPFTLEVSYRGKKMVHHFTEKEILREFSEFEANVARSVRPTITPKN